MRAVDSPYVPATPPALGGTRRHRYLDTRLFRWSPRYKQHGPYMEDSCPWREDVLDYRIVAMPWCR